MGVGYVLLPIILLFFYIIPLGLFFYKKIRIKIRLILLCIPLIITILFTVYAIRETSRQSDLYNKYPQMNKIVFYNPLPDVKDSIVQLQTLMNKLPKRLDNNSVSYSLDKYADSYNYFNFNWISICDFEDLLSDNNLRDYKISDSQKIHWEKYINSDLDPFDTLNSTEAKRFINLIEYLDINKLNGATLNNRVISLSYNDSLRISDGLGFRTIVIDTSKYYGADFYDVIDNKDGIFLLRKK